MALTKFAILPDQSGYSVTDGNEVNRVQLDGGAGRYRLDILNSNSKVTVSWNFDRDDYLYFRAFYNSVALSSSQPFLIDLLIDTPDLVEHEAYFIPGTVKLANTRAGQSFKVSAQLEIKPKEVDAVYDLGYVEFYNAYGDGSKGADVINQLEQLVNVDLPGSL